MVQMKCLSLISVSFMFSIHVSAALSTCSPGFYRSSSSEICSPCPSGTHQPKFGANGCIPCPSGFITTNKASTNCTPCRNGKTSNKYHTACECPVGYTLDYDSKSCKICPPGTEYMLWENSSRCWDCSPNSYQPSAGATRCLKCPAGTTSGSGAVKCLTCPPGQLDINGTCGKCPPGFYYQPLIAGCDKCFTGTFQDKAGAALSCKKCPASSYAGLGFTSCVFCKKGTALMKNGSCASCSGGEFYDETSFTCRKCDEGQYTPGNNVFDRCFDCGPNLHSFKGSTKCVKCNEGTTLLSSGKCGICPAGTYFSLYGRRCRKCRQHSFNSKGVEQYCSDCPSNYYALPGSSECRFCPIGKALILTSGKCETCPPGKFYDYYYTGVCIKCYEGTYKATTGIKPCDACPEGFVPSKNSTACVILP